MFVNGIEFLPYDNEYYVSKCGDVYSTYCGRCLKHYIDHDGYHRVDIHSRHIKVHKLVYLVWVGDIPYGLNVRHYDDDKDNNHVSNLILGTQKENIEDAFRNGHKEFGANTHHLIVYDKETDQELVFCPAKNFIEYCGHPSANGCVVNMFNKDWFKQRYEIIEYGFGKV